MAASRTAARLTAFTRPLRAHSPAPVQPAAFVAPIARWQGTAQGEQTAPSIRWQSTASSTTETVKFPGAHRSAYTEELTFLKSDTAIPTYRVMDRNGAIIRPEHKPDLKPETIVDIYKKMVTLNVMDNVLYDAQRQGRISFYMTNYGEEATHFGSAAALGMGVSLQEPEDHVYGQYREAGVLMWRGFTLDDFMNQCYSNDADPAKGRQMPVHYGSRALNFQTISSPLATQIPQAAGAAYALKRAGKRNVVICYFGEGAASEGDFHAALNVAATTRSPVIFFWPTWRAWCYGALRGRIFGMDTRARDASRNNGFAISTPVEDQYRGDGIASRGVGYGMATARVDGNDLFAVYNTVRSAREMALADPQPILIEAMTYRVGHHSTSDDSSAYRSREEVASWTAKDNPITRVRKYMEANGLWDDKAEAALRTDARKRIVESFGRAEKRKKPPVSELFTDVFDTLPTILEHQQQEMLAHIAKYPADYPTDQHAASLAETPHNKPKPYL